MSLKVGKDEIYVVCPEGKYQSTSKPWGAFMEEDFTIFTRVKVLIDESKIGEDCFILARNGQHVGISAYIDQQQTVLIGFTYWFKDSEGISVQKKITHVLLPEIKDQFNDYVMTCNHKEQNIGCYVNGNLVGTIDYKGLEKCSYKEAYMWLGCGTGMVEEEYRNVGNFEYELLLCAGVQFSLAEIVDLKDNYEKKYSKLYSDYFILNTATPRKEDIYFFVDFKYKTRYKIWNLAFNGCFPQLYIENNIIF